MRIVLPKEIRGYHFPRLFSVEMNDFDIERLLPSLFYLVITSGRGRGGRKNKPTEFQAYLDRLAQHSRVKGFDESSSRRMLNRWVRAAVVQMGRLGRGGGKGEQIEYALPNTILTYTTGFPAEIRRQRNAHVFLYQLLCGLPLGKSPADVRNRLNTLFRNAFGYGVSIGPAPNFKGVYGGTQPIDVHTLLSICYLEGFEPTPTSPREVIDPPDPALPVAANIVASDLVYYLLAYKDRLPVLALTRGLMALTNFGLFVYTVKLMHATNVLVKERVVPSAMQMDCNEPTSPELYVDFMRDRGSVSDELARACVDRDLEELRMFYESAILLRTIHRFAEFLPRIRDRLAGLSTPNYLFTLAGLREDSDIKAQARAEIARIKSSSLDACGDNDSEKGLVEELFSSLSVQAGEVEAAVGLLAEAQRKTSVESYVKWYWAVGGLRKPFGLLSGNITGRRNWRYAMSDDLLAALLQVAMVEDPTGDMAHVNVRPTMRLSEFLESLERRYGVIMSRPPSFLDDASARAAAGTNLESLKRRLRQMGFFQALSDDFNAQYLQMPELQEIGQ